MPWVSLPAVPSRLSRQYAAAGSRGLNRPVTRILTLVPVRLSGRTSTAPTDRWSMPAVVTGSATPMG